jgi:hypothetical protein
MLGLSRGLKFSLDNGVTHRDIKATNILIASNGEAKLVDFGLATIEGEDKKMAVAHGQRTVDYSALERTCGSPKGDPRSDIFFLGCVFYQMLTGQAPMPETESKDMLAKMLKRSFFAIKPLSEQRTPPPVELARIIEKMMKVDLKARYQKMDEVIADLEAYQSQGANSSSSQVSAPTAAETADAATDFDDMSNVFESQPTAPASPKVAAKAVAVAADPDLDEFIAVFEPPAAVPQERPLRRGPGRDPGSLPQGALEDGLPGPPRRRRPTGGRAVSRGAPRRRALRRRRPGPRSPRHLPRHAREGPQGRATTWPPSSCSAPVNATSPTRCRPTTASSCSPSR